MEPGADPETRNPGPRYPAVRIDTERRQAFLGDRPLPLTGTEFRLLVQLLQEPGRVWTRKELMKGAIAGGAKVLERTIDAHIRGLRAKLGIFELIETVRGVGYRFHAGPPAASNVSPR